MKDSESPYFTIYPRAVTNPNKKDGWEKVDASEEAYFNDSDDDDVKIPEMKDQDDPPLLAPIPQPMKRRLVDYPDDDDDDELITKRPLKSQPKMTIALKRDDTESLESEYESQNKKARCV